MSNPSKAALEKAYSIVGACEYGCRSRGGSEPLDDQCTVCNLAHEIAHALDEAERRGLERAVNACVARARALRDFGDGCDGDVKNLRDGANVLDDMAARLRALIEGGSDDRQR